MTLLCVDLGNVEVVLGSVSAHILLPEGLRMVADVGVLLNECQMISEMAYNVTVESAYHLLSERHLLELHLVDSGGGGAQQRSRRGDGSSLHDGLREK